MSPCAGEPPKGLRKANLTERTRPFLEEVALNEQVNAGQAVTCKRGVLQGNSGKCQRALCNA
jgi:hypothetical protein